MKVILAGSRAEGEHWCRENGVDPRARDTYIIASAQVSRGRMIKQGDLVVLPGVYQRDDYEGIKYAIIPCLFGDYDPDEVRTMLP